MESADEKYARLFDAMAEAVRQEAATADTAHRKALWGVAAGLEIAASALRDDTTEIETADARELVARFRETHVAYLLKKDLSDFHKRPPKLHVKRVIKAKNRHR